MIIIVLDCYRSRKQAGSEMCSMAAWEYRRIPTYHLYVSAFLLTIVVQFVRILYWYHHGSYLACKFNITTSTSNNAKKSYYNNNEANNHTNNNEKATADIQNNNDEAIYN